MSFKDTDAKPTHDSFALAVVVFRLLMFDLHPFEPNNIGALPRLPLHERIAEGTRPYAANPAHDYRPRDGSPPLSPAPPPAGADARHLRGGASQPLAASSALPLGSRR